MFGQYAKHLQNEIAKENVDAAILFSDILVVPLEMGMDLGLNAVAP